MTEPAAHVCHLYVDEAGDTTFFDDKGRSKVGSEGCSRYFMMGMIQVERPLELAAVLNDLRRELIADPYFSRVPSFDPSKRKTAILFHAKNDLAEVRMKVFERLVEFGGEIRFRAVVADKSKLEEQETRKRLETPGYRFVENSIYDSLTEEMLSKLTVFADRYELKIAKRGAKDRDHAIRNAIIQAEKRFEDRILISRGGPGAWRVNIAESKTDACLQAVDYYLWALQRFYNSAHKKDDQGVTLWEDRYLLKIWPQVSNIFDVHFNNGTYFRRDRPLTVDSRFLTAERNKKPQI
jgi:hypothetical protein